MKPFRFKQFNILQSNNAFKIGTDALLLGGWHSNDHQPREILDIGTGTGIVALMAAQRSPMSNVSAIELQEESAKLARANFHESPFSKRLNIHNTSLQNFEPQKKFDLILCNPPFFEKSTQHANRVNQIARHTDFLSAQEVINFAEQYLSPIGILTMVIPADLLGELNTALHLKTVFQFRGMANKLIKRTVASWDINPVNEISQEEIIIEEKRHHFTDAYIQKMKDFHPFL